jgi:hypothetical protein
MATNYAAGHSWDHLDGEVCAKAADEIKCLETELKGAKRSLEFVRLWAWREDPQNSKRKLTDEERLSAIKWHPASRTFQRQASEVSKT